MKLNWFFDPNEVKHLFDDYKIINLAKFATMNVNDEKIYDKKINHVPPSRALATTNAALAKRGVTKLYYILQPFGLK